LEKVITLSYNIKLSKIVSRRIEYESILNQDHVDLPMGKLHSFKDVIQELYYNKIFDELSELIQENPSHLESKIIPC
jgi:hypothetical protein